MNLIEEVMLRSYLLHKRTTKPGEYYQKYVSDEDKEKFKSLKAEDLTWSRELLGDMGSPKRKSVFQVDR